MAELSAQAGAISSDQKGAKNVFEEGSERIIPKTGVVQMPRKKKLEEKIYPEILNMDETRSFLRLSYDTVKGLILTGKIPAKKINREWRICKQDVIDWVRNGSIKTIRKEGENDG